jgi:hypothetical protein
MFTRFLTLAAIVIFSGSFANSKVTSQCIKKGNRTYCSQAQRSTVQKCPFGFWQKRKTLTSTEIQKCLIQTPLYCSGRVVRGQMATINLLSTRSGFKNTGATETGLFVIGTNSQVYKPSRTKSINACLKADRNGHVYFAYGAKVRGEVCSEGGIEPRAVRCAVQSQGALTDFSSCLARIYKSSCDNFIGVGPSVGDHGGGGGGGRNNGGGHNGRNNNGGSTNGNTDGSTNGSTDGSTNGSTDGSTNGSTDGSTNGTDGSTNGSTDGSTNGTDGSTNGSTDGSTNGTDGSTNGSTDGSTNGTDGSTNGSTDGSTNGTDGGNSHANGGGNNGGGNGGFDGKANDMGGGNDGQDGDNGGPGHGNDGKSTGGTDGNGGHNGHR